MSEIINYILSQNVDINTVYLLLALPFVATLITAFRQIVGIKSFGIYTPLVLTFAFWATGLKYGLAVFLVVLFTGTFFRYVFKKIRLLYMPRMAMVLTVISLAVLGLITFGGYMHKYGLASTSILPILIMITLIEKFISAQVEKGIRTAAILSLETLLISIAGYYFIEWDSFKIFIFNYPYSVLVLFVVDILLGKWNGLRLSEYFRFREVIKHVDLD